MKNTKKGLDFLDYDFLDRNNIMRGRGKSEHIKKNGTVFCFRGILNKSKKTKKAKVEIEKSNNNNNNNEERKEKFLKKKSVEINEIKKEKVEKKKNVDEEEKKLICEFSTEAKNLQELVGNVSEKIVDLYPNIPEGGLVISNEKASLQIYGINKVDKTKKIL